MVRQKKNNVQFTVGDQFQKLVVLDYTEALRRNYSSTSSEAFARQSTALTGAIRKVNLSNGPAVQEG